jgi:hypothetical protein
MKLKALWKSILQCYDVYLKFNEDALTGLTVTKGGRKWTWCYRTCKIYIYTSLEACSSVVGWGTMLQAGKSRVRFPMGSLVFFFNWPNHSSRTMSLWSTQPGTEMSTRKLPGGEGRPAHKADNLTAICKPSVYKMWEPRSLITLWAFTACYGDSLTFCLFIC